MTVYELPLVLDPQPEGGYVVTCPLVPELVSEGDSVDEALHNASGALAAIIEGLQAEGWALPPQAFAEACSQARGPAPSHP